MQGHYRIVRSIWIADSRGEPGIRAAQLPVIAAGSLLELTSHTACPWAASSMPTPLTFASSLRLMRRPRCWNGSYDFFPASRWRRRHTARRSHGTNVMPWWAECRRSWRVMFASRRSGQWISPADHVANRLPRGGRQPHRAGRDQERFRGGDEEPAPVHVRERAAGRRATGPQSPDPPGRRRQDSRRATAFVITFSTCPTTGCAERWPRQVGSVDSLTAWRPWSRWRA